MRRILRLTSWLLLAVLVLGVGILAEAHWEIRSLEPTLPERATLAAVLGAAGGPVRVSYANTSRQRTPGRPTMAFPAFILEWADGRMFLIDTGMNRADALAFGRPMELLLGSEPAEPLGSLGEQLGEASARVRGVAFTHLHVDHTGGLPGICAAGARELPIFQTPWQAELGNHTTRPGREDIAVAECAAPAPPLTPLKLEDGPLHGIPGFPGLAALAAGGHTPGSTIYFARQGERTWVFSGDITNSKDALLENRPKERIYSLLITPEAPAHLETLRRWLATLDAEPATTVVVSHDHDALSRSGIPPWPRGETSALP